MKRKHLIATLIAAAAILANGTAVADQTIIFNVPVRLTNLYADVKTFSVGCNLRNSANPLTSYGHGRADLAVNKNFTGTVKVPVKVPDSVASQVNSWSCEIYLFAGGPGCTPSVGSPVNACKAKAGTPLVTKVQGPLTPVSGGRLKFLK